MSNPAINRKTVRDNLKPRREPYWTEVGEKLYLGFRKTEKGQGRWIARLQRGTKKHYHALGAVVDVTYGEAVKSARTWAKGARIGVLKSPTVEEACKRYVEELSVTKGYEASQDVEIRFKRNVYSTDFSRIPLDRLSADDISRWRDGLRVDDEERSPNTINRELRSFKAAMNFAFERKQIHTDAAWRVVKSLPTVASKRNMYLDLKVRRQLFDAADESLRRFLIGLYYTGCRVGELRSARRFSVDTKTKTLTVSNRKGPKGEERIRSIPLTSVAWEFFQEQCEEKLPDAFLFMQANGWPWDTRSLSREFNKVREAVGLGDDVVPYCFRHTAISDWLKEGMDIGQVSKRAGTSIHMIDKYYSKYIPTDVEKLEKLRAN